MDIIVIYDVATPDGDGQRRLAQVARVCEGFGVRVQKSVFECRLSESDYVRLEDQLRRVVEPTRDRVTIYRFAGNIERTRVHLGAQPAFEVGDTWIL